MYLETTIVSYLAAKPSRDLVVAAHQELTFEWWETQRGRFALFVSDLVVLEASQGDEAASAKRIEWLTGIPLLQANESANLLAGTFIQSGALPPKAAADALHVAIATAQGMEFLLTWNCRHIANAEIIGRLDALARASGFKIPTICTPEQLMGS